MAGQDREKAGPAGEISPADCRAWFETVSDAILIQDARSGAILEVNQGMCEMFGCTPEEARQGTVAGLGQGEAGLQLEDMQSLLAQAAAGSPQVFECQARDRAGRVFWVEGHLKPLGGDGGPRILAVLRDIDRRKRAEEALKESEARYRMITEGSLAGVYVIQEGGFAYVNPTTAQIFGYRPEEILSGGPGPIELIHPDDQAMVMEAIRRRLRGEMEAAHYIFRGLHKDGSVIYCETFGRAVEYEGRPAIVGTLLDITERQRAEEALQTQTRVLESLAEGVTVINEENRIIYTNPAFDAMYGYEPGELIGQRVSVLNDFSVSESVNFAQEMLRELSRRRILSGEVRNRKKDGTRFYTQARISPLEISGKTCWILVQEDITERKQMEDALRESEASYRVVTEGSLAGVYLIQDGKFRYVNPVLAQAFGYRPDELIDRLGPMDLTHAESRGAIAADMQRLLGEVGAKAHLGFKGERRDGTVIFGEVLARQVEYQGRPAIMGTFLDVTERQVAEEALKASEEKYHTIFDKINDAITLIDPETGAILEVNQKFLESGYKAEEVKNLTVADLCSADHPFTAQEGLEWLRKAREEGPQVYEWLAADSEGRRIWVEINLSLIPLGGQERALAVVRDISERKQVEDIRRRNLAELEELVAERTAGLQAANTQLRREIEERQRTEGIIRLQRDLGLALSGRAGLRETLQFCVETAIAISGLDSGGVYLVDPETGELDLAYHQGFTTEFARRVSHYRDDSLNTYLVMAGRPLYARLSDLPGILDEVGLEEGLRSAAIIPVIHQDRVIAAINIASHQYEEVPATARAALETLATQVGSAIARVQAEEALLRAKEDLEIRVGERTAQWRMANELLESELQVRRRMEESLRQSEAKFRTLVEQMPAITYLIEQGEKANLLYISPQIETLLGFTPEEWWADTTEAWKRQIHPEDRERVLAELAQSIKLQVPFSTEYRSLAKDGRVVWFRDEARVVHEKDGGVVIVQGLALDITARKQAEAALRETTQTLQALIHAAPLAIVTLDRDFNIRLWNPEAERMFGWQEAEVLGGPLPFFEEHQLNESRARLQRQMAGEVEAAMELPRVRKDGSRIDTSLWTATLRNPEGEITGLVGVMADITARKRAEEKLRRQADLLNLAHDAIVVRDLDNRIVFWNSGAEETYGWGRDEALGRETHKLLQTEFPQPQEELEREFFRGGRWQGELTHTRRDGQGIVVASRWALQRDKEGQAAAILEINRDITERKQAEAGRARSADILDATSDLVGTADLKGRVLYLNRAGRKMVGIGKDEEASEFRVKDLQPEWAYRLAVGEGGAEAARHGVWSGETAFLTRSGQEIPTSQVIVAHRDPQGRLEFYSTIARDITASRRAAEALQKSEQELRLLTARLLSIQEQERRRVARELHDELGQALTVLKMHLVALEAQLAPDQQSLMAACEQMLSYIDTVIENVRRLSWDLSPSSLEDLGLSAALGHLVDEICRNHNLQSQVAMDKIDHLFSPETQINIYRIFQESLTNVVKHARASLVAVNVTKEDGRVSFSIRDNGRGFALKRALSRKAPARSLGLTAMNERAHMAAGSLKISSRKGRGTTITFAIPTDSRVK